MNKAQGSFFAFDGPNGSGKSSLVKAVAEMLRNKGVSVVTTREPTDSQLGQFIRSAEETYRGRALAYLVAADRLWHVERELSPALSEGKAVISDRYVASSLALQQLDGVDMNVVWELNETCLPPLITFIISAPPDVLAERLSGRTTHSRFERTRSREDEVRVYRAAGDFLRQKGYNVVDIENIQPLSTVVGIAVALILDTLNAKA